VEARSLFMRSRIGEAVAALDVNSQILYNRTLTQLGMAAFREGKIEECHDILNELASFSKLREALG